MEFKKLPVSKLTMNTGQIEGVPANPRQWTQADLDRLAASIEETPELLDARGAIVVPHKGKFVVLGGNMRLTAAKKLGLAEMPCAVLPEDTPIETLKAVVIKDNSSMGAWDFDALANEWDDLPLTDWGVPAWKTERADTVSTWDDGGRPDTGVRGSLATGYIVPPFTILDSRQGYWKERKQMWRNLIGDFGESRENTLAGGGYFQLNALR